MCGSRRWWIGLFTAALLVRLAAILWLGAYRHGAETAHHEHRTIARNLALGKGFVFNFYGRAEEPTSQQAPLVPGLLSACYRLLGVESHAAFLLMLSLQAAAGAAAAPCIASAAGSITGSAASGRWAGLGALVYPPLVVSSLHVQALVWNLLALAMVVAGAAAWRRGRRPFGGALFAAGTALGILADPILAAPALGLAGLLAWDAVRDRDRRGIAALAVVLATIALALAPWTLRNYRVHGRFVFVKDSFGYVFWEGNNRASQGTDKLLVDAGEARKLGAALGLEDAQDAARSARALAVSVDTALSPEQLAEIAALPREIERMDWFGRLAWRELAADPTHYLRMCGRRLRSWLWFDETNPRSFLWHYRLSYLSLAAAAIVGLCLGRRVDWRPILAPAAALTLVHVLIITSARFRIPLELLLLLPAGHAAAALLSRPEQPAKTEIPASLPRMPNAA